MTSTSKPSSNTTSIPNSPSMKPSTPTNTSSAHPDSKRESNPNGNRRLASSLLRDYYSLNSGPTSDPLDPDSGDDFNDELAFQTLLGKMKLSELMKKQASILAEIRELDGERQSLVYNHHHELVAASETIRTMKTKSSTLSPSLKTLQSSLSKVRETSLIPSLSGSHSSHSQDSQDRDRDREKLLKEIRPILILPQRLNDLIILKRSSTRPNQTETDSRSRSGSGSKSKAQGKPDSFEDPRKLYQRYEPTLLDWERNGIRGSREIREACQEVLKGLE